MQQKVQRAHKTTFWNPTLISISPFKNLCHQDNRQYSVIFFFIFRNSIHSYNSSNESLFNLLLHKLESANKKSSVFLDHLLKHPAFQQSASFTKYSFKKSLHSVSKADYFNSLSWLHYMSLLWLTNVLWHPDAHQFLLCIKAV